MHDLIERKLLIVEDNKDTYDSLCFALRPLITLSEISVSIEQAETLTEAKQKLRSFRPHVVSTDMEFPIDSKHGRQDGKAGAALVSHIRRYHRSTRCVVYSGMNRETIEEHLCDAAISTVPTILSKNTAEAGGPILFAKILTKMLTDLQ